MNTRRLFFALWPTDQVRHSIVETFSQLPQPVKGRVMLPHNLHVTLHFLGQVTESTQVCMSAAAKTINTEVFQLKLDCFGHFSKAKVFWIGSQNLPAEIIRLHEKLGDALSGCGFHREERAYAPHVTLMRKCVRPFTDQMDNQTASQIAEQNNFSIPWFINEFVLVESRSDKQGVNYQVIEKYPLS